MPYLYATNTKRNACAAVIAPLTIGILIYVLFRGIAILHLSRLVVVPVHNRYYSFLIYSAPDGLWLYAFLMSLQAIWQRRLIGAGLPWLVAVPTMAVLSEVAQYSHLIPGTFDINDIVAYLIATALFLVQFCMAYALKPKSILI